MATESDSRRFQADSLSLDADAKITETAEYLTVEPVTIAREGVFVYEDGRAFKPGDELKKGAEVSRTYLAWDHPLERVITKPTQIKGFADDVRFVKDGAGSRVKARLTFYKKKLTVDQQELIRSKARRDVSVGFYYEEDRTPGKWNGQEYDYVQRDFVYDHVASVDHGRCAFPACGIGVDVGNAGADVLTAEQKNRIPKSEWGYTPSDNRSEWKLPLPDRAHVIAALQALQGARGGVTIPRSALPGVKRKVCSFARKDGIKSTYCGTADANDAVALMQRLLTMDSVELVDLHRNLHTSDDFDKDSMLHRALLHALKRSGRRSLVG